MNDIPDIRAQKSPHISHSQRFSPVHSLNFIKNENARYDKGMMKKSMQPNCELRLVETIPSLLIKKGIKSNLISTYEAFMTVIKGAKKQFSMVSQWKFDGNGKGKYVFKEMYNG